MSVDQFPDCGEVCDSIMIPFFQFMNAPKFVERPGREEEIYTAAFNVRRLLAWRKPSGDWDLRGTIAELECCISYWGRSYDNGSWDGMSEVFPVILESSTLV